MPAALEIHWRSERLLLLGSRALWWPSQEALIVADLHLGKPASFRALGVPTPEAVTPADLDCLSEAIRTLGAPRLMILGDLLHASSGRTEVTMDAVRRWRREHEALEVTVVRGNHDRRAGDPPLDWGLCCVDGPFAVGPFDLVHEPETATDRPALAGHLHPAVAAGERSGPGRLRAPCFWFGPSVAVLPAFGRFTGCHVVRPTRGDRIFAVDEGLVAECATSASGRA